MNLGTMFMVLGSTVITGGGGGGSAAPAAAAAAPAQDAAAAGGFGALFGGSGIMMILVYAAIIGGMWFFMIRPQRKREKEMREMQQALKSGDNVITSSGFYGKIVSVEEDCFIIEFGTNKGIKIPVRKADIIGTKLPNASTSGTE